MTDERKDLLACFSAPQLRGVIVRCREQGEGATDVDDDREGGIFGYAYIR